jgi:hypothetical protein
MWRGDWSRQEDILDRLLALATKHSLPPYAAVAMGLKGELQVKRGRPDLGVNQLRDGVQGVRANRYEMRTGALILALAEGLNHLQQHAEALATINEAITLSERQGGYLYMPEMLRVKGEILASTPDAEAELAEQCFHDALQWSQRQSALSWELRAASSLARHWFKQGRIDRARRLLAPIYGRFTEGLDTSDLVTVREFLEASRRDH